MSEKLDLVRSIYADWERGEYTSLGWADPEIEFAIVDLPTSSGTWKGVPAMITAFASFLDAWEGHRVTVEECREIDDERILTLGRFTARGKGSGIDLATLAPRGANVFTVRDGRVVKLALYFDPARALADLGLEE